MGSTSEEVNIEQLKLLKSIFEVRRTPVRNGKEPHMQHAFRRRDCLCQAIIIFAASLDLSSHLRG